MTIYMWTFNTIPDAGDVECFIDEQMPLFSRNARYLTVGDGEPIVDLMRVEHNCGAVNLEFQLNGIEEQSGDVFCFPGYYPGGETPRHIHYEITAPDGRTTSAEMRFADDPKLPKATLDRARDAIGRGDRFFDVRPVERSKDGVKHCAFDLKLPPRPERAR